MKQIEYSEKQKIVLEVLEQVDNWFKPADFASGYEKENYFSKITSIKSYFGIKEKYLTLREYINKISCGAYHTFIFSIGSIHFETMDVVEFEHYHNPNLLDKYFVISDNRKSYGCNCENYHCEHYLELAEKGV